MKNAKACLAFALFFGVAMALSGCPEEDESGFTVSDPPKPTPNDVEDATTGEPDVDEPDIDEPEDVELGDVEPDGEEPDADPSDADDADDVDETDTGPPDPPGEDYVVCDAGDEAWVKQTIPLLLGRRPQGIREVRVFVDMIAQTDRETVARAIMRSDDFQHRWRDFFMDELRVNRAGDKKHPDCYGAPGNPGENGQLAAFIRDNAAFGSDPGFDFNMSDVLSSSLALDDMSPYYRAHLFAMMAKPITGANVGAVAMDITRRQDFGEIFEATYLHRNVVCIGCHNSTWGITDNIDPALDKHWAAPGKFEVAIYGKDTGIPEMELYSIFRHLNVVRSKGGERPWKMNDACGRFQAPGTIKDDPAEYSAFFIDTLGLTASVWDTEARLQSGFDGLRLDGLQIDEETLEVSGPEAFAWLVSQRIVNRVWREAQGYPLTLVHYFSRNEEQLGILMGLTQHFVDTHWSLKTLLVDVVTHPMYNDPAPEVGCGSKDHEYMYPPVFNPWTLSDPDEAKQGNSVGDVMHRYDARVLLRMVNSAMLWAGAAAYPGGKDENFQKAVGLFVKDAEPGFEGVDFQGILAWEDRYGACDKQQPIGSDQNSCLGICSQQASGGCWCDEQCLQYNDCCGDFQAICVDGEIPAGAEAFDWIDLLGTSAQTWAANFPDDPLTLTDAAIALKDRLLTETAVATDEAVLIAGILGVDSLDAPLGQVDGWQGKIRRYCGVLLQTPQFMLAGVSPADQAANPKLTVGATSYKQLCEKAGNTLFDPTVWSVTCEDDSLVIEAAPEPEPEAEPDGD